MAQNKSRKTSAAQSTQNPAMSRPSRPRKMRVIESGRPEHDERFESAARKKNLTDRQVARAREREEFRYSGTPLGSDPRE
jgi:hypothetical protein